MTVLDLSNYDADTLDVACMKAAGVTGVILGCQRALVARQMADKLQAGGLPIIGVYAFLYLGIDSTGQAGNAIDIAHEYGVRRVWLDVESTGASERAGITPAERIAEVANCVAMLRSAELEPGIYTGRWYWVPYMENTAMFSDLPLWHSEYPADGHEVRAVNYGGWTNVAIHQYTSTLPVCGRNRDANYVFVEDDMADPRVDALIKAFGGQAAIDAWNINGNSLLEGYAIEQSDQNDVELLVAKMKSLIEHVESGTAVPEHSHVPGGVVRP